MVGCPDGFAVGAMVGETVGFAVGVTVGRTVGFAVEVTVGRTVGFAVGVTVVGCSCSSEVVNTKVYTKAVVGNVVAFDWPLTVVVMLAP